MCRKIVIIFSLITLLVLTGWSAENNNQVSADELKDIEAFQQKVSEYQLKSKELDDETKLKLMQTVKTNIDNGTLKTIFPLGYLDFSKSNAKEYNGSQYFIQIPTKSDAGYAVFTSLTVSIDFNFNIDKGYDLIVTEKDNSYHLESYVNGDKVDTTDVAKIEEIQEAEKSVSNIFGVNIAYAGYINDVNNCLARFGVSRGLLAIVSATCGLVCIGTIGAGCLSCYGAYLAVDGGIIVGCLTNP